MKERTADNVHRAYVAEAKAIIGLSPSPRKRKRKDCLRLPLSFERLRLRRVFMLEGTLTSWRVVLEIRRQIWSWLFQRESNVAGVEYRRMVQEADEDGDVEAVVVFSQARDVEEGHARLYRRALNHLIAQRKTEYHVCQVGGYLVDGQVPENCPVCGAPSSKFAKVR